MKTALYTTLYPDALEFWDDFIISVEGQSDQDFDLHVALDMVSADDVDSERLIHFYIPTAKTPSTIRQETWQFLIDSGYDAIIMTDADDAICPDRIKNAKAGLVNADIDVCGMQFVNEEMMKMQTIICPDPAIAVEDYIFDGNDIGLGNSAYRAEFLQKIIPLPDDLMVVDWFMALRAVEEGARFNKRADLDMLYRQHGNNVSSWLPPYTMDTVTHQFETELKFWTSAVPSLNRLQDKAQDRLDALKKFMDDGRIDEDYIAFLNGNTTEMRWWHKGEID